MASNTGVQFWGKETVLQAYRQRNLDAWSLWQGKQFLTGGIGVDSLCTYLDMLQNSGAVYTLKVYNGIEHEDDIYDDTPFSGSFNFKLQENPGAMAGGVRTVAAGAGGITGIIQSRIEAKIAGKIDKWLENLDDDEDEDEPQTLAEVGMSYLKNPEMLAQAIAGIKQILGGTAVGFPGMQSQPAYVGKVQRVGIPAMTDEEKYNRIGAAIETLEKADTDILIHLEKLADISVKNPVLFKQLITMLAGM